jgi:hypothetical protein
MTAQELLLPPLVLGPHTLNLFCTYDPIRTFDATVAACWAWMRVSKLFTGEPRPKTEDYYYTQAQAFHDQALVELADTRTRKLFVEKVLPCVGTLKLPRDVQVSLAHAFIKELKRG